jgi:hypothetical protein
MFFTCGKNLIHNIRTDNDCLLLCFILLYTKTFQFILAVSIIGQRSLVNRDKNEKKLQEILWVSDRPAVAIRTCHTCVSSILLGIYDLFLPCKCIHHKIFIFLLANIFCGQIIGIHWELIETCHPSHCWFK